MLLRQPLINRRRQQKPGLAVNWPEVAHRGNILEERSRRALSLSGPPHGVKSDRLLGQGELPAIEPAAKRVVLARAGRQDRERGPMRFLIDRTATGAAWFSPVRCPARSASGVPASLIRQSRAL